MNVKSLLRLFSVAVLFAVACQKGVDTNDEPVIDGKEGISRFSVVIDSPEVVSRASLEQNNLPLWEASDRLLVLSYHESLVGQIKAVVDVASIDGASASFSTSMGRTIAKDGENYAIYPYYQPKLSDLKVGSEGKRTLKLALEEQVLGFDEKLNFPFLFGEWDEASESFTMVNPLLAVRLKMTLPQGAESCTISQVEVSANNGEPLWGTNATFDTADRSFALAAEGATSKFVVDDVNEKLDDQGRVLSFFIPAVEYSKGLKVKILCLEGIYETDICPTGIDGAQNSVLEIPLTLNITTSDIFVDAPHVTDTTITVAWTSVEQNIKYLSNGYPDSNAQFTEDIGKDYKVAIYSNADCTELVYSVEVLKGEKLFTQSSCPPRFIFAGLTPKTDYYIHIYNLTDSKQTLVPLKVTTAASEYVGKRFNYTAPGDVVLYENFDHLIYGGDISACAAGVSRDDRAILTSFAGAELKGAITLDWQAADASGATAAYIPAAANVEMGLFNSLAGLLDDMTLDDWGWIGGKEGANGGSVCARPGYVKIGTYANRSFIVTPTMTSIPEGVTAKVTVRFKAAPYGDVGKNINTEEKSVVVKVLNGTSIASNNLVTYTEEGESSSLTLDGNNSSDWKEYSVTLNNVNCASRIAIGGGRAAATDTNRFLLDDITICIESLSEQVVVGQIKYDDGTPAADVVVSDGFNCVKTDINGNYSIMPHKDTWYIFYSVPSEAEVMVNDYGQPCFFAKYNKSKTNYNFTIKKSVKESKFALFCFADVQCANTSHINRFKNESVPDILAHSKSKGIPCYGVTLGDVVYSQGTRNCEPIMPTMRNEMAKDKMGMPVFQTFGNHDYSYLFNESNPLPCSGYQDLDFQLKIQRSFEDVFGPINYSWNRGDVHIVCMRNMLWYDGKSWDHYGDPRFLDVQYQWLKQDLEYVPKDKMVILCVHCSVENADKSNVRNILKLLSQFKEAHIMSGHHHRNTNFPTKSTVDGKAIYEHNHGAVCGHFWRSRFNGDGVPNGYGVYEFDGNKIVNWYYKGVNEGMNDRSYQMRLYRGNLKCGGEYDYIELQHGANVILANVFNADDNWKVKVYEDGIYAGDMSKMARNNSGPNKYSPDVNNPGKPSTSSSLDWWITAYHTGVLGLGDPTNNAKHSGNYKDNFHMYKWTLKNPNAKDIRVEATDQWGNVYTTSTITGDYDYAIMNY